MPKLPKSPPKVPRNQKVNGKGAKVAHVAATAPAKKKKKPVPQIIEVDDPIKMPTLAKQPPFNMITCKISTSEKQKC